MDTLKIATRGSKLALWQANHVKDSLEAARPGLTVDLVPIKTRGDKIIDRPLAEVGGKALFVKEIQQALYDGVADVAVHSMKDVPAEQAPGLIMAATSVRADPRDALCTRDGGGLDSVARGATIGTASMRRMCQLKAARPDLVIESLRGNVPTRLARLDAGDFDAVVLAAAGLDRLGFADRIGERMSVELSLPAVGQGVLGIETRADDDGVIELVRRALHDPATGRRVAAERAFLAGVGGSCQTPLAGYATGDDTLELSALVGEPDGSTILREVRSGPASDAEALGTEVAEALLARGAGDIIAACEAT